MAGLVAGLVAALVLALVLALVVGCGGEGAPPGPEPEPEPAAVARVAVSFRVQNVNTTAVPCPADGAEYTVSGVLAGPREALASGSVRAGSLYLHGLNASGAEFFDAAPNAGSDAGASYINAMAARGEVSVAIDRLGYAASPGPPGVEDCLGAQADMAHQIVQSLRAGDYATGDGSTPPRLERVVLGGHSAGSLIAELAAHTFGGIDGLILMSYSDLVISPAYRLVLAQVPSYAAAVQANLAHVGEIEAPTLIVIGGDDPVFPPPAGPRQAELLSGSADVTQVTLPGVGHALTLEPDSHRVAEVVDGWLEDQGLSTSAG